LSKRATADQELKPWPRFLASSFLVKEEVGWQSENCRAKMGVKDEERGDLSTVLTTSAPVEMTGGEY
jgi:hypothetical protein